MADERPSLSFALPARRHSSPALQIHTSSQSSSQLHSLLDQFLASTPIRRNGSRENILPIPATGLSEAQKDIWLAETQNFLIRLASALHVYGTPTHFLEYHMVQVSKGLGHDADFAVFPTYMLVTFMKRDQPATSPLFFRTVFDMDMYKLQLVDELARRVASYASVGPPVGHGAAEKDGLQEVDETNTDEPRPASVHPRRFPQLERSKLLRAVTMSSFSDALNHRTPRNSTFGRRDVIESDPLRASPVSSHSGRLSPDRTDAGTVGTSRNILPERTDLEANLHSKDDSDEESASPEDLKRWILDIASFGTGFFGYAPSVQHETIPSVLSQPEEVEVGDLDDRQPLLRRTASEDDHGTRSVPEAEGNDSARLRDDSELAAAFEYIAVEDATRRLKQIISLADYYPEWAQCIIAGVAVGGGAGLFFSGGWWDVLISAVLGTAVRIMQTICERRRMLTNLYEVGTQSLSAASQARSKLRRQFLAAVVVALTTRTLIHFGAPICYSPTILSSILFLLQGVTITLAMVELATRNMISGTARLAYGLTMTGLIGYGLDLGATIPARIFGIPKLPDTAQGACPTAMDSRWSFALFLPTSLALSLSLNAHPLQLPVMTLVSFLGFAAASLTEASLSPTLSSALGSFCAGLASNIHARVTGAPAVVGVYAALNMLVPGGLALRGISKVIDGADVTDGLGLASTRQQRFLDAKTEKVVGSLLERKARGSALGFLSMALEDHADGYHGSPRAEDSNSALTYDDVEVAPRRSLRSANLRVNGSTRQNSLRQLRAQQRSRAPPACNAASSSRVSASRERFQPRSNAQSVPGHVSLRAGPQAQSSAAAFRALSNAERGPERITSTRNRNHSIACDARLGTRRLQVGRGMDDSVMCLESDEEVVERRPNPAFLRRVSSAVEAEHAAYSPDSMRFLDQLLDHPTPGQRLFSSDVGFADRHRYASDASGSLSSSSSASSTSVSRKRKRTTSGAPRSSAQAETRPSEIIDLTESPAAATNSTAMPVRSTRSQGVSSFGTRLASAQRVRDSVATYSYPRDNILQGSESVHAEDDMSRAFFLSNDPGSRQSTRGQRRNRQPLQSRLPVHRQSASRPPLRLNGSTRRSPDTSTSSTQQRDNGDVPMSDEEFARMLQEMEFSAYQPPGTPLGDSPLSTRPLPRRQATVGVGTGSFLSNGYWEDGYIDEFIPELSGLVLPAVYGMVRRLLLGFCSRPPFMGLDPRNYMLDNSMEMDYEAKPARED
ncbi:hypothetical protein HDU85_005558 [Gaertneriomyces sp. JEL0708]|nr:hypothetical protein HDU85_005558 [Gaertneriomyces sp. JEL0708]